MGLLAFLDHLFNFLLPVLAVGALSVVAAKWLWRRDLAAVGWARLLAGAWLAGGAVWVASLVLTGHDGQVLGYASLVVATALGVWLAGARAR